jgi:hypothetical protein
MADSHGAVAVQLYSAFTAALLMLPFYYYSKDVSMITNLAYLQQKNLILPILLSAFGYHSQWISQFQFMEYVGAISFSVANVVKRGVIIWLSTIYFQHPITPMLGYHYICMLDIWTKIGARTQGMKAATKEIMTKKADGAGIGRA